MISKNIPSIGDQSFEELKQSNEHDAEYWSARDLQPRLGYSQWRRFEDAIKRAITSCEQSGNNPGHHFAGAGKMIEVGKGGAREVDDYQLSRFACYLIAQNGDPRKAEIAHAQKYFAIQARKQELSEQKGADRWKEAEDDRLIGGLWAELSDGRCRFVMVKDKQWEGIEAMLLPGVA
jgi:DNA-damage-inducible protein D